MSKHPVNVAFDRITEGLNEQEISLLRKVTGESDKNTLVELFFTYLITYKAVYNFPTWEKLRIEDKKQIITLPILSWHCAVVLMDETFSSRCIYNAEDDLKLKIRVKGLDLKEENELIEYLKYQEDKYDDALYSCENKSHINWLERSITNTKKRLSNMKQNNNLSAPVDPDLTQLLSIPTNASNDQILKFWLNLLSLNEKNEPYWTKDEIEHFVNQNFMSFSGVKEIKKFSPNMNFSELYQVMYFFFLWYGQSKSKSVYAELLTKNFTKFMDKKNIDIVCSNIKNQPLAHLAFIFKKFKPTTTPKS